MINIILPVFNQPEYTRVCLESLRDTPPGADAELVIVDNGSRRRTKTTISSWMETASASGNLRGAEVLQLPENAGFAGAINAAARAKPGVEFTCVLHNDTVVFPGWAAEMLQAFSQEDHDTSIVMPRTCYANERGVCLDDLREEFQSIKPPNKDYISAKGIQGIIEKLYPQGKEEFVRRLGETEPRFSYSIDTSSFCMLFRTSLFQDFGYFDEEFFPRGFEDKFWFLPMERVGMACCVANRAFVHHFGNVTTDGPGFCFPTISALNERRFKRKVLELDEKFYRMSKEEKEACQAQPEPPQDPASSRSPPSSCQPTQSAPAELPTSGTTSTSGALQPTQGGPLTAESPSLERKS